MLGPGIGTYQTGASSSILSLLKKINFSSILNTTQKTLNIANQAIPLIYQVKPLVNNAKTVFKIIGAVKNDNGYSNKNYSNINKNNNYSNYSYNTSTINNNLKYSKVNYISTNAPKFFI